MGLGRQRGYIVTMPQRRPQSQRLPHRTSKSSDWRSSNDDIDSVLQDQPQQKLQPEWEHPPQREPPREQQRPGPQQQQQRSPQNHHGQHHTQASRPRYATPTESYALGLNRFRDLGSTKRKERARNDSPGSDATGDRDSSWSRGPVRLPAASVVKDLQGKFVAASYTTKGPRLHEMFMRFDREHTGGLNLDEFSRAVRIEGKTSESKMNAGTLQALWNSLGARVHDELSVQRLVEFVEDPFWSNLGTA